MKNQNIGHCRAFLSGLPALLKSIYQSIPEGFCRQSHPYEKVQAAETPDTHIRGWKQAFTLIELLVVVLIIGILAAIALPQYQKAVERSKSAQALTMLRSVYQAAEEYYLANGTWPESFSDLSVVPPWTGTEKWVEGVNIKDVLSDGKWSIELTTSEATAGMSIGNLSGKYAGVGFYIWHKYSSGMQHTVICAERIDAIETPGDYCQKVMQAGNLLYTSDALRYYKMP